MGDFRVLRGTANFGMGATTLDVALPSAVDVSRSVERITCVQNASSGPGTGTPTAINNVDVGCLCNLTGPTTLRLRREGNSTTARVDWEVIEYIGAPGGANEWVVISRGQVDSSSDPALPDIPLTPTDVDRVGAFLTGTTHDASSRDWDRARVALYWDPGASELVINRGDFAGVCTIVFVVVEFLGSNWSDVQWVEHEFTAGATDETETITDVGDWANTMIWSTYRCGVQRSMDALSWTVREGATTTALRFRIQGTPTATVQVANAWVVSNSDLTVEHLSSYEGDYAVLTSALSGSEAFLRTVGTVGDVNNTSLVCHTDSTITGNGYPSAFWGYTLATASTVALVCARGVPGAVSNLVTQTIQWPDTAGGTDYTDVVDDTATATEDAGAPGFETVHWRVTANPFQIQEYDAAGNTVGAPITAPPAFRIGSGSPTVINRFNALCEAVCRAQKYGPGGSNYAGSGIQVIEVEPGINWFHGSWSEGSDVDKQSDGYWNSNYPNNPKLFPDSDYRPIRDLKITTTTPGTLCTLHNGRIGRLVKEDSNIVDPGPIDNLWYDEVEFLWLRSEDGGQGNTNQQYCWGGGIDQRNQNGYIKITNSTFRRFPGPYGGQFGRFVESCIRGHSMILHLENCTFPVNPSEHLVYVDVPRSPFDIGAGYRSVGTEIQTQPGTDRRGLTIRNCQHIADPVTGDPAETGRTWVQVAQRQEGSPPGNGNSGPGDGEILIEDCVFRGNGNFGAHGLTFVGFVGRPGVAGFARIILRNLQLLDSNAGLILSWSDWGKGIFTKQGPTGLIEEFPNAPPPGGDAGWNTIEYTHQHTEHLVIDNVVGNIKPGADQQRSLVAIEGTGLIEVGQFQFDGLGRAVFDFHYWGDNAPGQNRWTNEAGGGQGPLDNQAVRFVTQASTSPYVTTPMDLAGGDVASYGGFGPGPRVRYGSQRHPDSQNGDGNLTTAQINGLRDFLGDINYPPFGPGAGTGVAIIAQVTESATVQDQTVEIENTPASTDFIVPISEVVFADEQGFVPSSAGYRQVFDESVAVIEGDADQTSNNPRLPIGETVLVTEMVLAIKATQLAYYANTRPGGVLATSRSVGGAVTPNS